MMMTEGVKIISSVVLFGAYECPVNKKHDLRADSIVLSLKRGGENMNLQLSFKHITKVELLDNIEQSGAGLILHVNEFMAQRIQMALDPNGTGFSLHQSPYAKNRFIVMDILNSDPETIRHIKIMLHRCDEFHRAYVIEQCNKNGSDSGLSLPPSYICVIFYNQWRSMLGTMGKDTYLETIQASIDGIATNYVLGQICPIKSQEVFTIYKDGTLVSRRKMVNENRSDIENSQMIGSPRNANMRSPLKAYPHLSAASSVSSSQENQPMSISQGSDSTGYMYAGMMNSTPTMSLAAVSLSSPSRQISVSNGLSQSMRATAAITPTVRTVKTGSRQAKREVHVIEMDDDEDAPEKVTPKKRSNGTAFVYPSTGKNTCSVQFADLRYLDCHYMLNDTIIDFYLKYILHDLVSPERRSRIFMFNSFFYTRLSQIPTHGKVNVTDATRNRRIATNFSTLRAWTKHVNLFEKEQIIIPINEDIHWYLAVIVNASAGIIHGENNGKPATPTTPRMKNGKANLRHNRPYIIVFDSLIDPAEPKHTPVKKTLAEYLYLEYNDKKERYQLPGSGYDKASVGIVNPRGMPQQMNFLDCGLFLLHFAEIFMTNPPKTITLRPSFFDWFPDFEIKDKRYNIRKCIQQLASDVKFTHFLADPRKEPKENKTNHNKSVSFLPYEIPTRTRSYSESSIDDIRKEKKFTSSLRQSRSLDSILSEMNDALAMTVSVRDLKKWNLNDD